MYDDRVRTTLSIDDDILAAAKQLAAQENRSLGETISALARRALLPTRPDYATRNGVPLLPLGPDVPRVTSKTVKQLDEELL